MDSNAERTAHWQAAYQRTGSRSVSWFQDDPAMSLRLLAEAGLRADRSVVDVGGGASSLVDRLVDDGVTDVTVVDIADSALAEARDRLGAGGRNVSWLAQDLLAWHPDRRFDIWHDRAVFHFLVSTADRDQYRGLVDAALAENGQLVIGVFALDGPEYCSGLPVARYDPETLAAEFPGFRLVGSEREEHRTPDRRIQPFTWVRLTR